MGPSIRFFSEEVKFKLTHPRKTSSWLKEVARLEGRSISSLNIVFCSDEYLLQINQIFLNHRTLTDIITFDLDPGSDTINAEIYISVPRVQENAIKFKTSFELELHRVMVHGMLHLQGYDDKSPRKKSKMRDREDSYLSLQFGQGISST